MEEIKNKTVAWDSGKLVYHASGQEPTWLNHHFKKINAEELSFFVESIKNSLDEVPK
jgi:hypothetical protein